MSTTSCLDNLIFKYNLSNAWGYSLKENIPYKCSQDNINLYDFFSTVPYNYPLLQIRHGVISAMVLIKSNKTGLLHRDTSRYIYSPHYHNMLRDWWYDNEGLEETPPQCQQIPYCNLPDLKIPRTCWRKLRHQSRGVTEANSFQDVSRQHSQT